MIQNLMYNSCKRKTSNIIDIFIIDVLKNIF